MSTSRRSRRRIRVLLALLAGPAVALALLELALRLGELGEPSSGELWAVYDPVLGYRNNPALPEHNELGVLDDPIGPKVGTRLVMLGDSVTYYGDGPDDTYVGRLERLVREQNPDFEAVNASVRGYTTHQELAWLERDGTALEPDLVGIGFVLNDLHRFLHGFRVVDERIVGNDYGFTKEALSSVESPTYQFLRRSRALVWLRRRMGFLQADVLASSSSGYSFEHRPDFRTAWLDEPWEEVRHQLTDFARSGLEHGFRPFVVVFPFGEQYRDDYLERDRDYVTSPQIRLTALAREVGIPLLDLYASLDPETDLEEDGIHLTVSGRERAAALIAEFLIAKGLLLANG